SAETRTIYFIITTFIILLLTLYLVYIYYCIIIILCIKDGPGQKSWNSYTLMYSYLYTFIYTHRSNNYHLIIIILFGHRIVNETLRISFILIGQNNHHLIIIIFFSIR